MRAKKVLSGKNRLPLLLLQLALLSAAGPAAAGQGAGTTSANFLKLGGGARAVALGGAFTALADDANAIAYNPAGLAVLRRQELSLMHNEYMDGIRQEWAVYALPSQEYGTFAAAANVLSVAPFAAYDAGDHPTGEVSAQDSSYGLAYARSFGKVLHVGAGAQMISSQLADHNARTSSFDAGMIYEPPITGLRLAAALLHAGAGMRFVEESSPLPRTLKVGVAYTPLRMVRNRHVLTICTDVEDSEDRGLNGAFGLEYESHHMVALRFGWRGIQDAGLGLSAGLGVFFNDEGLGRLPELRFDYTFVDMGGLTQAHRIGVTLRFGPSREVWIPPSRLRRSWFRGRQDDSPLKPETVVEEEVLEEESPRSAEKKAASPIPRRSFDRHDPTILKVNP
ncbi:MAG: PorV/PorQ family protein [Elusimicrobiota bacterium]